MEKVKLLEEENAESKKHLINVVKLTETIANLEEENMEYKKNNKKVNIFKYF